MRRGFRAHGWREEQQSTLLPRAALGSYTTEEPHRQDDTLEGQERRKREPKKNAQGLKLT